MSRLAKNKLLAFAVILVAIQIILAVGAPLFAPYDPMAQSVARRLRAPSGLNWFGTDQLGRDVLTRILYGYRTSLIACLLAVRGGADGLPQTTVAATVRYEEVKDWPKLPPGVEMGEAVMLGEALAQGALARGGGAVDGDDHGWLNPGSSRRAPE